MTGTWRAGWAPGDILTAAEVKKGIGAVYDTTLSAPAASIDTGAVIPAGYGHLRIVLAARSERASAVEDSVVLRFNNSTDTYFWQRIVAQYSSVSALSAAAQTYIWAGDVPATDSPDAGSYSAQEFMVADYASTTRWKQLVGSAYSNWDISLTNGGVVTHIGGSWANVAAITRVTVFALLGDLSAGTRLSVYVMGASG